MATICVVPAVAILGNDARQWGRVMLAGGAASREETAVALPALGAVAGAWVGAVPIPLDWDVPWQVRLRPPPAFAALAFPLAVALQVPALATNLSMMLVTSSRLPMASVVAGRCVLPPFIGPSRLTCFALPLSAPRPSDGR
jgi:hypothetical protein